MPFKKGEPSCRKYEPTPQQRRQVMTMTGFGIRQREVASVLGIDEKTLRLHFRRELDTGATEANLRVASSLFQMATKEHNVAAAIWWTKARMGWKETTVSEQTGPDGGPLSYVIRGPRPVESAEEWLRIYAPPHDAGPGIVIDADAEPAAPAAPPAQVPAASPPPDAEPLVSHTTAAWLETHGPGGRDYGR